MFLKKYGKELIMLTAAFAIMLCTGCGASPQSSFSNHSSSSASSSSSSSRGESSDSTPSSLSSPSSERNSSDDYEQSSSSYNDTEDNASNSNQSDEMTYMDYVITYRDEIIDGAIDVEYEHFAAHPTGLEYGYVKFSGEIMQVFEDQKYGYDFYSILMNITYVPGNYSSRYTDTVLVSVIKNFSEVYPSVGDIATVWGMSRGFLAYENIFCEAVAAPHVLAAQISYGLHNDMVASNGTVDFAATDLLGLTVDDIAVICGHSPSDYIVEEDSNYHMAFHADDALILYSLSGYTSGTVRSIDVKSSDIKLSNGFGDIDNVRIGMTETEFLNTVMDYQPESYGVEGLYMLDIGDISFMFVFNDEHILTISEVGNYNIIF